MIQTLLIVAALLAVAVALLSVRLFFGRKFVHTHIEGNKAMAERGIACARETDARERRANPHAVGEKSK